MGEATSHSMPRTDASAAGDTADLRRLFNVGLEHQSAGRVTAAERCYEQVLTRQPRHFDTLHMLGAAAIQSQRYEDLGPDFDSGPDAFLDTAAVMESLDLIITSDTSIAHLAGALARPTWVALKHIPDWRWMLGREDSPWYPRHRLFRQETRGQWDGVFEAMRADLSILARACDLF
jgi:hypothetical protein